MRKRYFPIVTAISAAFVLAACSQTDVVDLPNAQGPAADNAISFGTYSAKAGGTRAGYKGNMTKDALAGKVTSSEDEGNKTYSKTDGEGFGVFAYYTGKETYGVFQGYGETTVGKAAPNFMYNQKVESKFLNETSPNVSSSDETYWHYSPLKYWPNDFAENSSDKVDKQNPPATGSGNNGGNVSFFAYAPHVTYEAATADATGTGITGMTANTVAGDPKITYTIGSNVDLLWGTLDHAKMQSNVMGTADYNTGVQGKTSGTAYEKAIETGYWVAADLTKQKVDDNVKFNFIHALAGIGGTTEPDPKTPNTDLSTGFMVRLDLDNDENGKPLGTIDGGKRVPLEDGDGYQTIVTIESITIKNGTVNKSDLPNGSNDEGENDKGTTVGNLTKTAQLNLATGRWERPSGDNVNGGFEQTIETTTTDNSATNVKLNPKIAENKTSNTTYFSEYETADKDIIDYFKQEETHPGVTETLQNVYADGGVTPLLFIPGDRPVLNITVTYVVRTYDKNLAKECATVKNTISKNVVFPVVKMNKHYTLIMHLGLTSVKFIANVSDWEKNGDSSTTPGMDDDEIDEDKADAVVDLPANVK